MALSRLSSTVASHQWVFKFKLTKIKCSPEFSHPRHISGAQSSPGTATAVLGSTAVRHGSSSVWPRGQFSAQSPGGNWTHRLKVQMRTGGKAG